MLLLFLYSPDEHHTMWHNNLWLDLNYLEVAKAAQFCGASFSAVLFTEIYWGIKRLDGLITFEKKSALCKLDRFLGFFKDLHLIQSW